MPSGLGEHPRLGAARTPARPRAPRIAGSSRAPAKELTMQTAKCLSQTLISTAIFLGLIALPVAASAASEAGFHYLPAKEHHFAFSKVASVVQINGEGPFDITYINAADDPQKAAKR
jgi:hypothetical protein